MNEPFLSVKHIQEINSFFILGFPTLEHKEQLCISCIRMCAVVHEIKQTPFARKSTGVFWVTALCSGDFIDIIEENLRTWKDLNSKDGNIIGSFEFCSDVGQNVVADVHKLFVIFVNPTVNIVPPALAHALETAARHDGHFPCV